MKKNLSTTILLLILLTSCNQARIISKTNKNRDVINDSLLVSNIKNFIDSINVETDNRETLNTPYNIYFWNIDISQERGDLYISFYHSNHLPYFICSNYSFLGFFKYKDDYIILEKENKVDYNFVELSKKTNINTNLDELYKILPENAILPRYLGYHYFFKIDKKGNFIRREIKPMKVNIKEKW